MQRVYDSNGNVVAIVFSLNNPDKLNEGTHMFTPPNWGVQIGIAKHSKGYSVAPHIHIRERNEVVIGTEILIVLKGRIRVSLYGDDGARISDVELREGEGIVLSCAHSTEFLEDAILVEIKEGPYPGPEDDKVWL
jgi:hypothetical protein